MARGTSMGKNGLSLFFGWYFRLLATSVSPSQLNFHVLFVNYVNNILKISPDCYSEKSCMEFYFKINLIPFVAISHV